MNSSQIKSYNNWKKRKIRNFFFFIIFAVIITIAGYILGYQFSRNDETLESNNQDYSASNEIPNYNVEEDEGEDVETEVEMPTPREPVVYCGAADHDDATILSNTEALSYLSLVNRCYRVAQDFSPHDLSIVNVDGVNFPFGESVHHLRETAARQLELMFAEATKEGLHLILSSAYRNYDLQNYFLTRAVNNVGREQAMTFSAVPGHSEHQLGLGADLTTPQLEGLGWLHRDFSTTPEGIWVNQNAHHFGFIISFPYGREADVAIIYEPWHIRYVGVEVATQIFENGMILEEFLWYNQ